MGEGKSLAKGRPELGLVMEDDSEASLELTKPVWPKATHCLKHQDSWALAELGTETSRRDHSRKSNPKKGLFFFLTG